MVTADWAIDLGTGEGGSAQLAHQETEDRAEACESVGTADWANDLENNRVEGKRARLAFQEAEDRLEEGGEREHHDIHAPAEEVVQDIHAAVLHSAHV